MSAGADPKGNVILSTMNSINPDSQLSEAIKTLSEETQTVASEGVPPELSDRIMEEVTAAGIKMASEVINNEFGKLHDTLQRASSTDGSKAMTPKDEAPKVETPKVETPTLDTMIPMTTPTPQPSIESVPSVEETSMSEAVLEVALKESDPVGEKPVETPAVETLAVATPVVETPVVGTPVVETPVVETPVVETPVVETPVVGTPVVETPVVEETVIETPAVVEQGLVCESSSEPEPVLEQQSVPEPVVESVPAAVTEPDPSPVVDTPIGETPVLEQVPKEEVSREEVSKEEVSKEEVSREEVTVAEGQGKKQEPEIVSSGGQTIESSTETFPLGESLVIESETSNKQEAVMNVSSEKELVSKVSNVEENTVAEKAEMEISKSSDPVLEQEGSKEVTDEQKVAETMAESVPIVAEVVPSCGPAPSGVQVELSNETTPPAPSGDNNNTTESLKSSLENDLKTDPTILDTINNLTSNEVTTVSNGIATD